MMNMLHVPHHGNEQKHSSIGAQNAELFVCKWSLSLTKDYHVTKFGVPCRNHVIISVSPRHPVMIFGITPRDDVTKFGARRRSGVCDTTS